MIVEAARSFDVQRAGRPALPWIEEADVIDRRTICMKLNGIGAHRVRARVVVEKGDAAAGGHSYVSRRHSGRRNGDGDIRRGSGRTSSAARRQEQPKKGRPSRHR